MRKGIAKNNCLIVAEVSANHYQDFKTAEKLIKEAKRCGADAVKFQAYIPETLTINVRNKYFRIKHPRWGGQTLYELYEKTYMPLAWLKRLKKIANDLGIIFFATAYDKSSVDILEGLNVPFHKVASFELIDLPFISYVAKTKKPIMLSTGMATLTEVKEAVTTARKSGAKDVILLKCVSDYPAKAEDMNLKTMLSLGKLFKCEVGLSDHTLGIAVAVAAVSLGAKVVEKHFTLSRRINTPDRFFSLEPPEFKNLVEGIRIAEGALGKVRYGPTVNERKSIVFRRSLFAIRDIKKEEFFTTENIRSIRPSYGLKPKHLETIIGKKALREIKKGTPLSWNMVGGKS